MPGMGGGGGGGGGSQQLISTPQAPPDLPIMAGPQGVSALPGVPNYTPIAPAVAPVMNTGSNQGMGGISPQLIQLLHSYQSR